MRLWGKKEYKCNTCGATFDSQAKLDEHTKSHVQQPVAVTQ